MEKRGNKTIMCSVLFLDIVAYSKKSVAAQIAQKQAFNSMLANAIRDVPVNDRVILDTGDGAAVTFLGDVEDALKAVLAFRESLLGEGANMSPPLQVCMGINLGPVRVVEDINGHANIVGDGINVAQRIMGFAKPGQILVSRSYFDAASRLSHDYAGMFYHEGDRTDKHEREHEVYAIGRPGDATAQQQIGESTIGKAVKQSSPPITEKWLQLALTTFQNATLQQRTLFVLIIATALALLIVLMVRIAHWSDVPAPQVEIASSFAPVSAPAVTVEVSAPSITKEATVEPEVKSFAPEAVTPSPQMTAAPAPEISAPPVEIKPKAPHPAHSPTGQRKENRQPTNSATTAKQGAGTDTADAKPGATASVNLAINPWGEVYLDGIKQGVSPPLDILHVTPGEHDIEIRNTTFPPYLLSIQVKADEQMKIRHKFTN